MEGCCSSEESFTPKLIKKLFWAIYKREKTSAKHNADVTDNEVGTPCRPCMLTGRHLGRHCRVPTWIQRAVAIAILAQKISTFEVNPYFGQKSA